MRKSFYILIILVILAISVSLIYVDANQKARQNYISAFNRCMEIFETRGGQIYPEDDFAQDCISKGGCYNYCGSACYTTKPYVTLPELITNFFYQPTLCIQLCTPECLLPIESYQPLS